MTQKQATDWIGGGWRGSPYAKTENGMFGIDVDGAFGFQCFDFVSAYSIFLGLGRLTGGYAYQLWDTAPPAYQRVQDPQPGDIAVFENALNNGGGHTCAVIAVNSGRNSWVSVDQNWYNSSDTEGSPPANVNHNANHLIGFLRPPLTGSEDNMATIVDQNILALLTSSICNTQPIATDQTLIGVDIISAITILYKDERHTALVAGYDKSNTAPPEPPAAAPLDKQTVEDYITKNLS